MPATLFDQTPTRRGADTARPLGLVMLSVVLHAGALAFVIGLQLTTSLRGPAIMSRLEAFVAPAPAQPVEPPSPAQARSATPAPAVSVAAPAVAADSIAPEPARAVPAAFGRGVPSGFGLPTGTAGDVLGELTWPNAAGTIAPPPPAPRTPARVGGDIRAPARVSYVPPAYPRIAQLTRVEGDVVIEATIDEAGRVSHVIVRQSVPLLDRAAIDAVSEWRYTPTRLNGEPVAVVMLVTVSFRLR
jgi:protein TonB